MCLFLTFVVEIIRVLVLVIEGCYCVSILANSRYEVDAVYCVVIQLCWLCD